MHRKGNEVHMLRELASQAAAYPPMYYPFRRLSGEAHFYLSQKGLDSKLDDIDRNGYYAHAAIMSCQLWHVARHEQDYIKKLTA